MLKKLVRNTSIIYSKQSAKKIFCIGRNKTGTYSLGKAFKDLGFVVGDQREAELLLPYYKVNNFKPIINYCKTAQVFRDFPFSYPETYKHVDKAYSKSKFILTIRSTEEEWYRSVTRYLGKLFANGRKPTAKDIQNADYVYKGWLWECNRLIYPTPESDPYNKEILIKHYQDYNNQIIDYFKNRPKDFLVLNLAEKDSYKKFCNFLNVESSIEDFPWENKTSDAVV